MTDTIERRLEHAMHELASTTRTSPDAWERIAHPQGPRRRSRLAIAAAAVLTIGAVLAASVVLIGGRESSESKVGTGRRVGVRPPGAVSVVSKLPLTAPRYGPSVLTVGDGTVWVGDIRTPIDEGAPTAFKVDPATGDLTPTFAVQPIIGVDPETGAQVTSIEVPDLVSGMAYGFDALWVVTQRVTGTAPYGALLRIDPSSRAITGKVDLENPGRGIAVGHGSVWVTDGRFRFVYRIDPETMSVRDVIPEPATAIASNRDGVWIAYPSTSTVRRINPQTNTVDKTLKVRRPGTTQFLVAAPTRVWLATSSVESPPRLIGIDSRTAKRLQTATLRGNPTALAFDDGLVWCMINAIRPDKRLVSIKAQGGDLNEVKMNGDVKALALAVADGYLFAANQVAGELVRLR